MSLSAEEVMKCLGACPLVGVRYNVVRRPLSGGRGTIVQGKGTKGSKCPKCKGSGMFLSQLCAKCNGCKRIGAKPAESVEAYHARLAKYIQDEPATYFMRWNVRVTPEDIVKFCRQCLDPVLENLCDDHEWWAYCYTREPRISPFDLEEREMARKAEFKHHFPRHFLMPFGIRSPLLDGGATDLDEFLQTGSIVGLQQVTDLFPELR